MATATSGRFNPTDPVHLHQLTPLIMRSSNNTIQQSNQRTQYDIYAFTQHRQQAYDIENQSSTQLGHAPQQSAQVLASRQTALIYVRERPTRPLTPPVVVAPPQRRAAPPSGAREMQILGGFVVACVVVAAGAAAAKSMHS